MSAAASNYCLSSRVRRSRQAVAVAVWMLMVVASSVSAASYHYNLSLTAATGALARMVVLSAVELAVGVADPCAPRLAQLAPRDAEQIRWQDYERVEHALQQGRLFSASRVVLREVDNPQIIRSDYPFRYQPYDEPRLHELRERFELDQIVAGAKDEFEEMVLLRNWSRSQFRRCDYQLYQTNFDALEILTRRDRNETDEPYDPERHFDPCHFFPLLCSQVLLSMGHQARLVSSDHGMLEVWSNQYGKWVLMDAELNLHYELNGVPLGGLELRQLVIDGKNDEVQIQYGEQTSGDLRTTFVHLKVWELAPGAIINGNVPFDIADLRNDWMTNYYFRGHPARSDAASLTYDDKAVSEEFRVLHAQRPRSRDLRQFNWTLNQAEVLVRKNTPAGSAAELELAFRTVTPNFDYFEIVVDQSQVYRTAASSFRWMLHPGRNSLRVRPVNRFGVPGIESALVLDVREQPQHGGDLANLGRPRPHPTRHGRSPSREALSGIF